jgi:putative ATP-binding cassette transporter
MNLLGKIFRRRAVREEGALQGNAGSVPFATIRYARRDRNLSIKNLSAIKADGSGEPLVIFGDYTFMPGDRVMVEGASGCGKSTLMRIIRDPDLWEYGSTGEITKPRDVEEMFVPSSDYLPDVTLRQLVCGRHDPANYSTEAVMSALLKAGLGHITPYLDDETKKRKHWRNLSDGQKKRLSVAGILLRKPAILELDEITSALDPQSEQSLYKLLISELPETIILSIVHREAIRPMHNVFVRIENGTTVFTRTSTPAPLKKPVPRP